MNLSIVNVRFSKIIMVEIPTPASEIIDGIRISQICLYWKEESDKKTKTPYYSGSKGRRIARTNMDFSEETILAGVDGKTTVRQLRSITRLPSHEFGRALYCLLSTRCWCSGGWCWKIGGVFVAPVCGVNGLLRGVRRGTDGGEFGGHLAGYRLRRALPATSTSCGSSLIMVFVGWVGAHYDVARSSKPIWRRRRPRASGGCRLNRIRKFHVGAESGFNVAFMSISAQTPTRW